MSAEEQSQVVRVPSRTRVSLDWLAAQACALTAELSESELPLVDQSLVWEDGYFRAGEDSRSAPTSSSVANDIERVEARYPDVSITTLRVAAGDSDELTRSYEATVVSTETGQSLVLRVDGGIR